MNVLERKTISNCLLFDKLFDMSIEYILKDV